MSQSDPRTDREQDPRLEGGDLAGLLFESNPQPAWIFDVATLRFLAVNTAATRCYGYAKDDFLQLSLREICVPEDLDDLLADVWQAAAEPPLLRQAGTRRHRRQDGTRIDVEVAWSRIVYAGRGAILSVITDVTAQRLAEAALWQSEDHLRAVVNRAPVVLWATDVEGRFTLSEGRGLAALDLRPGEIVGRSIRDVYRDHPRILECHERALAGEQLSVTIDVGPLVFESYYAPLRAGGRIAGVFGVATDVTDRKRAAEALRASEQKFRTIADTLPCAVYIYQDGRFPFANAALTAITGYALEEIQRIGFWDLIHPDSHEAVRERMAARQAGQPVPARYEVRIIRQDGQLRWLDLSDEIIEYEGHRAALGTAFDVTDRRQAEALDRDRSRVVEMVATNQPLAEILRELVDLVERQRPEMVASMLLLRGDRLYQGAAPHMPGAVTAAIADGIPLGPAAGSCGTAAYRGQTVITPDIERDPVWKDYGPLMLDNGLRAAWSVPILSAGREVLGTFALYYKEPRRPTAEDMAVLQVASGLAAVAIEQRGLTDRLAHQAHHDALTGTAQPRALRGPAGRGHRPCPSRAQPARGAVPGPRPVQGDQRLAGSRPGRPAAAGRGRAPAGVGARGRHGRAPGRRRVHPAAALDRERGGRRQGGAQDPGGRAPAVPPGGARPLRHDQHRRQRLPGGRRYGAGAHQEQRQRALSRQGARPRRRAALRARDERAGRRAAQPGGQPPSRAAAGPVRALLPAGGGRARLQAVGVEALLRWHHPERGLLSPAISSTWPRSPGSSRRSAPGRCARRAARSSDGTTRATRT